MSRVVEGGPKQTMRQSVRKQQKECLLKTRRHFCEFFIITGEWFSTPSPSIHRCTTTHNQGNNKTGWQTNRKHKEKKSGNAISRLHPFKQNNPPNRTIPNPPPSLCGPNEQLIHSHKGRFSKPSPHCVISLLIDGFTNHKHIIKVNCLSDYFYFSLPSPSQHLKLTATSSKRCTSKCYLGSKKLAQKYRLVTS